MPLTRRPKPKIAGNVHGIESNRQVSARFSPQDPSGRPERQSLPVEEALNQLKFTPNKPAGVLYGVVRSALANAAQFPGIDVDSMYVKDVVVNEGPT